jgi:microcystin-dependent protein
MLDVYIGTIRLYPYDYVPYGWMPCDGRSLPINQYTALYSLIGTSYGGDGKFSFNIPNLKDAEPEVGMRYYIACQGLYPPRD